MYCETDSQFWVERILLFLVCSFVHQEWTLARINHFPSAKRKPFRWFVSPKRSNGFRVNVLDTLGQWVTYFRSSKAFYFSSRSHFFAIRNEDRSYFQSEMNSCTCARHDILVGIARKLPRSVVCIFNFLRQAVYVCGEIVKEYWGLWQTWMYLWAN